MTTFIPRHRIAIVPLGLLACALMVAPGAFAQDGGSGSGGSGGGDRADRVIKTGKCSSRATWKLKLKDEDAGLESEFEVDQNRSGQRWRVQLFQNGDLVWSGIRTTRGPSGSFSIERQLADNAGTDTVRAKATHVRTGATCSGTVSWG